MRKLCIAAVLFLLLASGAYSMSTYTTHDSWRVHYSPNSTKASVKGVAVQDGWLTMGASARNVTRFAKSNDNDLHIYLRGHLSDVTLGSGFVGATINLRGATDTSGRVRTSDYRFFYDGMDLSKRDDAWDLRVYQANVKIEEVIPFTYLTAGRMYVDYLDSMHIDGGDLRVGTSEYYGYVVYGLPVSFYKSSLDTQVVSGGLNASIKDIVRLRAEMTKFMDSSDFDADTLLWKLRGDLNYAVLGFDGVLYAEGGQLEDAWVYDVGTYGNIEKTNTEYNIWLKGQYDYNDKEINLLVSDFDMVNGAQSQYTQFGMNFYQGVAKHFAFGVGFETRYNYDDIYGDRDYFRYMLNLDFVDIIPNNFISLTADYWYVPQHKDFKRNSRIYVGGSATQTFTDKVEGWLGAAVTNYRYYYKQYDKLPTKEERENKKLDNSVYLLYAGLSITPIEQLSIQLDYTYENSKVIKAQDSSNDTISTISLAINYMF